MHNLAKISTGDRVAPDKARILTSFPRLSIVRAITGDCDESFFDTPYYYTAQYCRLAKKFNRNSSTYRKWRKRALEKAENKCAECGSGIRLEVHHIEEYGKQFYARVRGDNAVVLCKGCHSKKHSWMNNDKPKSILRKRIFSSHESNG